MKDRIPYDLLSVVVYKYTRGRCNSSYYGETERHLKGISGEYIGISSLVFKKTKRFEETSIRDNILQWDNNRTFDEFIISEHRNKNDLLQKKDSFW